MRLKGFRGSGGPIVEAQASNRAGLAVCDGALRVHVQSSAARRWILSSS